MKSAPYRFSGACVQAGLQLQHLQAQNWVAPQRNAMDSLAQQCAWRTIAFALRATETEPSYSVILGRIRTRESSNEGEDR